jgi:hypothetical protein
VRWFFFVFALSLGEPIFALAESAPITGTDLLLRPAF